MKKYIISIVILFCFAGILNAKDQPPNILFIVADDLGWADLECYGADLHLTPNLNGLANQGMLFSNAYAAAPICSPTRASIMTGKYPARLNMTIWHEATKRRKSPNYSPGNKKMIPPITVGNLPLEEITIAERLKKQGYLTAHLGKWHLGEAEYYPENQGFDFNIGGTLWGAPPTFFFPFKGGFGRKKEPRYVPDILPAKEGDYLTDKLTDKAIDIINSSNGQPFFINLDFYSVHTPIEAKEKTIQKYRPLIKKGMNHTNPTYAAMLEHLDENVGRLLKTLDDLKLADNTIVIFTSDNGGYKSPYREMKQVTNNTPLRSGKGSLYEGGIRIPFIVRWNGHTKNGTRSDVPVITNDIYPTLCEVANCQAEDTNRDGLSLVSLLKSPSNDLNREDLYFHYPHYYFSGGSTPASAIRSGDYKLIEYFEDGRLELYNLKNDLGENNNLASKETDITLKLYEKLKRWQKSVAAQMPEKNPAYQRK
jgi:arylsulfatase A-like enzyme